MAPKRRIDTGMSALKTTTKHINRLILEDSPYLLQHAHNPVDWHPWSDEAFARAKKENKPIFLSIGYSTCHWCHVMERESFEDPAIAAILNQHFIPIKVDRESHPDVDQVYMTAVILLTGHGGWPMSTFLTPEGKPFFGGTYYRPGQFTGLLKQVAKVWREQRAELESQADRIAAAVAENNRLSGATQAFDPAITSHAVSAMEQIFDELQGGFGQTPKFPQESWLFLLLDQAERYNDALALEMLTTTLDHMMHGGIYDQVGGGYHRYSTDYEWLVPHFEKMLYNQAHLSRVYLGAWRLTGRERYRRVATQTLDYVLREMTATQGGFYSATARRRKRLPSFSGGRTDVALASSGVSTSTADPRMTAAMAPSPPALRWRCGCCKGSGGAPAIWPIANRQKR
jgi:uncharacterized protein YyaL (SSP411 family)